MCALFVYQSGSCVNNKTVLSCCWFYCQIHLKNCCLSSQWLAAAATCCDLSALWVLFVLSWFFLIHSSRLHTHPAPVTMWHLQRFISCPSMRCRRHLAKSCSGESDDKRQTAHSEPHQPSFTYSGGSPPARWPEPRSCRTDNTAVRHLSGRGDGS